MTEDPSFLAPLVSGQAVTVPLAVLRPEQLLRSLNGQPMPVRVTVEEDGTRIELDVGNGFVMGAEGGESTPAAALERFLRLTDGVAELSPTRFLQMANLICPIEKVLGEKRAYVTKTLRVQPSVPSQAQGAPVVPSDEERRSWSFSTEGAGRARELSETEIVVPEARRRWTTWVVAAACVLALALGAIGGLWAARADASEPLTFEKAVGIGPVDRPEPPVPHDEPTARDPGAPERGELAQIRLLIRRGERERALELAEQVVAQRPGAVEVQLVLGDTRYANGQRGAARRAWRRALRLQPGYRPALRRLERHGGLSSTSST